MKVLQISFSPIVDSAGGAEKVFCNMSNYFIKTNEVVDVCIDNTVGRPFYFLEEKVKFVNLGQFNKFKFPLKIKILNEILRLFKKITNFENPKDIYRRKKINMGLRPLLEDEQPDVIICYELRSMVAVAECGYPLDKIVVMFHMDAKRMLDHIDKKQEQILHKVKFVQVLLKSDMKLLIEQGYNNVVCIGNIVPQYENDGCAVKEKTIIHVGRLDKIHKRQHLLIAAFARIAKKYPDWNIKFYGGDCNPANYCDELQQIIRENKIDDQVFLMGRISNVDEALKKASIFAFPSAFEGFPLALTEAMSVGIPSVGFKTTLAVNEIIKDNVNGILCDESINGLSAALEQLIKDEQKRLLYGKQAKEDMKQYAPEIILRKWQDVINQIRM